MFGPKIRNVFKSRWHALFWSASILLTAYCSVPSPDEDESQSGVVQLVARAKGPQQPVHKNPWAKDSPAK